MASLTALRANPEMDAAWSTSTPSRPPSSERPTLGIAHVVSATGWGGMEARTLETAAWQADAGHRVVIITPETSATFAEAERRGLRVAPIDFAAPGKLASLRQMRRALLQHRVDVADFHTNRSHAIGMLGLAALVRSQHNLKKKPPRGPRFSRQFPYGQFISTSEAGRDALTASGAVKSARISVVGEWAAEQFFAPVATPSEVAGLRHQLGVAEGQHVIGACAMLRADNAFDDLIRATALMRGRGVDVACLLVGGPPTPQRGPCEQERALRALAHDLGVEDAIKFLGHRSDVPDLFSAMDVATVVSRHTAQTRVGPEAAARGRPVVGFAVGALGETVREGLTGRLVPQGDLYGFALAVERLLRDRAERESLSQNAAAFARRNFRQGPKMEQTLGVYRAALVRRRAALWAEPGLVAAQSA
ncbi:MAG: glycosyltransferase family 4 protein [Caulobacteraceae bacterium]